MRLLKKLQISTLGIFIITSSLIATPVGERVVKSGNRESVFVRVYAVKYEYYDSWQNEVGATYYDPTSPTSSANMYFLGSEESAYDWAGTPGNAVFAFTGNGIQWCTDPNIFERDFARHKSDRWDNHL